MSKAAGAAPDESRLAQRAAAGDGDAFAELYERYERRAFNLCYRILGSEDDAADATQEAFVGLLRRLPSLEGRDLAFGSYLFTSARNACYDLIERRRRAEPSDEIAESSIPVGGGVGGGGFGFDPGDPEDDPERNVLLDARQEEIRAANATLPERQREALALKELEELSYDEIAAIMGMNRNSVAQLISRARINLGDALRGSALASITAATPECEQALALIAAGQDGQPAADAAWLELHLHECETCRLGREAMEEAGVSYRAWLPVAAAPVLFRETMAEAAEAVGADWSHVIARRERSSGRRPAGRGRLSLGGSSPVLAHRRRDAALICVLALTLLGIVFAGTIGDDAPQVGALPAADEAPATAEKTDDAGRPAAKTGEPEEKKGDDPQGAGPTDQTGDKDEGSDEPGEPGEPGEKAGTTSSDEPSRPRARSERPAERAGGGPRRGGSSEAGGGASGGEPPARTADPPGRTTTPDTPSDPPQQPERPDPPDEPPPPPPPEETPPVREQPPTSVPGCRAAAGVPIPCPPRPLPPPPRRPPR